MPLIQNLLDYFLNVIVAEIFFLSPSDDKYLEVEVCPYVLLFCHCFDFTYSCHIKKSGNNGRCVLVNEPHFLQTIFN